MSIKNRLYYRKLIKTTALWLGFIALEPMAYIKVCPEPRGEAVPALHLAGILPAEGNKSKMPSPRDEVERVGCANVFLHTRF
jgi:hypothetical protein